MSPIVDSGHRLDGNLLASICQSLPGVAVLALDRDLHLLFAGGAGLSAIGFTIPTAPEESALDQLPGRLRDLLAPACDAAFEGISSTFEYQDAGKAYRAEVNGLYEDGAITGSAVVLRDVTAAEAARRSEQWFQQLLEFAPDAIVGVDREGRIVLANRRVEAVFGYAEDELEGQPLEVLIPSALRGRHRAQREAFTRAPRTREMGESIDLRALRKDGTEFPCEVSLAHIETPGGPVAVAAIRDITQRRRMELRLRHEHARRSEMRLRRVQEEREELAQRVYIDPLTDLHNRAYLDELLAAGWPDAEPLELMGVVMVDVDHFKQINDTYGHQVGDAVLTAVAGRLSRAIRRQDDIARWGGEEFCIVLKGITDEHALLQRAEELRVAICARPVGDGEHTIHVTASVGAVVVPAAAPDPAAAVGRADEALYEAKRAGRNCTRVARAT